MPIANPSSALAQEALKEAGFEPGVVYMPVPRCDNCKWWAMHWRDSENQTWGDCDIVGSGNRARTAYVDDFTADFTTRSDFGCIQWAAK